MRTFKKNIYQLIFSELLISDLLGPYTLNYSVFFLLQALQSELASKHKAELDQLSRKSASDLAAEKVAWEK